MRNRTNAVWMLLILALLAALCSVTVFAVSEETVVQEEPTEPVGTASGEPVLMEPVSAEPENPNELTPEGNLALIDDLTITSEDGSCQKQFLTVQSRDGNYFYIIIDRNGEEYNVHFLNKVDEADLMSLTGNAPKPDVCICTEKCGPGHINTDCPVCSKDISRCAGRDSEPTEATEATESGTSSTKENGKGSPLPLIILGTAVAAGIGAAVFLKFRKKKPAPDIDEDAFDDFSMDSASGSEEIDLPTEREDNDTKEE